MNLNLIIDEEAFFSIFGRQSTSGFNQRLLNSIELPLLANANNNGQLVLPYGMPLSNHNNGGNPPIPLGGPPVPLVVSALQLSGAPNYVYPITDQTQYVQHGYLADDPIQTALNTAVLAANAGATVYPPVGNRIKAAFAQFLWARHGGSGYIFGYGNGGTGQNSAVDHRRTASVNAGPTPSERPFRSLSFPDINYTIMRPAALPPSTVSNPAMVNGNPALNAASVLYSPLTQPTTSWYFLNPNFVNPLTGTASPTEPNYYAPFVTTNNTAFPANTPIVYSGDPGVRNPFLNQGYVTGAVTLPTSPLTVITVPPYCVYVPATVSPCPAPAPRIASTPCLPASRSRSTSRCRRPA